MKKDGFNFNGKHFSQRQAEVMLHLFLGETHLEISLNMKIALSTVGTHMKSIHDILQARSAFEVLSWISANLFPGCDLEQAKVKARQMLEELF